MRFQDAVSLLEQAIASLNSGQHEAARISARRALVFAERASALQGPDLDFGQQLWLHIGLTLYQLGDLHGARDAFTSLVALLERHTHPGVQAARGNLAATLAGLGDLLGAKQLEEDIVEHLSRTLPQDHSHLLTARHNLAGTLKQLGDLHGARLLEEQVLEARVRTLPPGHPDTESTRFSLAGTLYKQGDLRGARRLLEQVLDTFTRTLPADHPDIQSARANLASVTSDLGDVGGARHLQEQVLEFLTRTLPADHPDLQAARNNLAISMCKLGDLQSARCLLEQVLEVRTHALPTDHPDLQAARNNLAAVISELGDLHGALQLQQQTIEALTRTLPADHPDLQTARLNLASTIRQLGDLHGARKLQEQVLEVRTRTLPADHPDLQTTRQNLANTVRQLGDLHGARNLDEQTLEICTRTLPADHPDLQTARANLAITIRQLGDLHGARKLDEQTLEVRTRTLPADHPDLQTVRNNLAVTLSQLGDLHGARKLHELVLDAWTRMLPDDHPHLQTAREALATTLLQLGDLHGARKLQEQVLGVRTRTLPADHPDLQTTRQNLANTLYKLGDLDGARRLQEHVLEALNRTLEPDHPYLQAAQGNLASTLFQFGDLPGAQHLQEQVLEVLMRTLPTDHPALQTARANLAVTLSQLGDLHGARNLQGQVLEVLTRTLPPDHPELQNARIHHANTLSKLGDLRGARCLLEQALEVCTRTLPTGHPYLQSALLNLSLEVAGLCEFGRARLLVEAATDGLRSRLHYLSTNLAYQVVEELRDDFDAMASRLLSLPSTAATAHATELGLLGLQRIAIDVHRQRVHHLRQLESTDPAVRDALSRVAIASAHFHRLLESTEATSETLQGARAEQAAADHELTRLATERGVRGLATAWPHDSVRRLQAAIPVSGMFLLTAHYQHIDFENREQVARVAAYLVTSSGIERIDLGPADPISNLAEAARLRLENRSAESLATSLDPAHRLMNILAPLFEGIASATRQIWLCPDGPLASIPWDALPFHGTHLGGRFDIRYLATPSQAFAPPQPALSAPSLLCFGGIDFGNVAENAESSEERTFRDAPRSGNQHYPDLPGSTVEARRIVELFRQQHADAASDHREKDQASRAAFLEACPGKRFVHLATHAGFGIPGDWALTELQTTGGIGRAATQTTLDRDLLAWIVFAGANREREEERARSLLSASEIKHIDLSGCEVVAASACETNVGSRFFGEGVSGLNRALHLAGARYSITSLWRVEDEGARWFFTEFYRRLWGDSTQSVVDAFRMAREHLRAMGEPPAVWAAFVLYGPAASTR